MRLLVLGGTRFAGRWLTTYALELGHAVTLFHRGRTGADLFPEAQHVLGDRATDLGRLAGRFDAVVDFCGYLPRVVRPSVERLADSASYTFVSSISVYADGLPPGADEDAPVRPPHDADEIGDRYGELKVGCEEVVRAGFGDRAIVVRPGFVVGPFDPTDRFPSLVRRAAAGGEMLLPGPPDAPLQFVDARDLAAFLLLLAERGRGGTFHAVRRASTVREVVQAAGPATRFTWVDPDWLLDALGEERDRAFPLWAPEEPGFHALDPARALAAGLACRPIAETVRDVLAWDRPPELGLTPERECLLLALSRR